MDKKNIQINKREALNKNNGQQTKDMLKKKKRTSGKERKSNDGTVRKGWVNMET